jgi:hypothetical protein
MLLASKKLNANMLTIALVNLYTLAGYYKLINGKLLSIYNELIGVHKNYNDVDNATDNAILPYIIV